MSLIPRLRTALVLLALSSLPALAQINPKWFTTQSPDFLNLYQQSTNLVVKPEVVTVLDFSGSMSALMYHKNYPNNDLGDSYPSGRGGWITFQRSGSSKDTYTVTATISAKNASGYKQVDNKPYGGGPGMVMLYDPLVAAIQAARAGVAGARVLYLSPQGRRLDQAGVRELAERPGFVLVVQGERERLIPFLPGSVVQEVDLVARRVRVDWDPDF